MKVNVNTPFPAAMVATAMIIMASVVSPAGAQTCQSPLPLTTSQAGNTCNAGNALPSFGGIASPQRDIIYRIDANVASVTLTFAGGKSPLEAYILPACSPLSDPLRAVLIPVLGNSTLHLADLTGSPLYLVVTADPSTSENTCGHYTVDALTSEHPQGSCANPAPLNHGERHSGDTCQTPNSLHTYPGGIPSPQRDFVYRIGAGIGSATIEFEPADFHLGTVVLSQCSATASLLAHGEIASGQSGELTAANLPATDNYLVIAGASDGPANGCGEFAFTPLLTDRPPVVNDFCNNRRDLIPGQPNHGDTCLSPFLEFDLQGWGLPGRGDVFRFTIDEASNRVLWIQASNFPLSAVVTHDCRSHPLAVLELPPGQGGSLDLSELAAGEYRLIISSDPSFPVDLCGSYVVDDGDFGVSGTPAAPSGEDSMAATSAK